MSENYEAREQQVLDRYLQASYGLWNALLTINGIILAVFGLLSSVETTLFNWAILIMALVSIALLTHNYVVIKRTYFKIGQVISGNSEDLTEDNKEHDIQQSLSRHKCVQWSENICLGILCIQAVLILLSFVCAHT